VLYGLSSSPITIINFCYQGVAAHFRTLTCILTEKFCTSLVGDSHHVGSRRFSGDAPATLFCSSHAVSYGAL